MSAYTCESQKGASGPQELELEVGISSLLWNGKQAGCYGRQQSLLIAEPSLQPLLVLNLEPRRRKSREGLSKA